MKCPFCNSRDTLETGRIHRGDKNFIEKDDYDIMIMQGWLYEIKCNNCNMNFCVDKNDYYRAKK